MRKDQGLVQRSAKPKPEEFSLSHINSTVWSVCHKNKRFLGCQKFFIFEHVRSTGEFRSIYATL